MANDQYISPKAFISYSWSSDTHEAWVIDLATRLMQDGVQVILDKWDLKVGHDANAFMESMVTDPTVTKVLLICDNVYAEKANGRMGGVGKEAQILTREIYEKVDQDKYAALITERDADGKAITPAYYGGRQFIDFSKPELAETSYEDLQRWIWNKPRHVKPKLGKAPAFITDPDAVVTGTTSKFKRAEHAIISGSPAAGGLITEFGEALIAEFEESNLDKEAVPFDDEVIRHAASMRPALRHLIEVALAEARYAGTNISRILRIFEGMGRLMYKADNVNAWREDDFDSFRMMCYEGFLALTAVLILEERFDVLGAVLRHPFVVRGRNYTEGQSTTTFRIFCQQPSSFARRNQRLGLNRLDLYADLILDTYSASFPSMDSMIEADIVLYLRGMIVKDGTDYQNWWPSTIIHANYYRVPDLFARSESALFFEQWAPHVFGPISADVFREKVAALSNEFRGGHYGYPGTSLARLTNAAHIGIRS